MKVIDILESRDKLSSWALLPATRTLLGKNKASVDDIIKQEYEMKMSTPSTLYIASNGADKFAFLGSGGDGIGIKVGDRNEAHHDQTGARLGAFTIVNIITYKHGEVIKSVNDKFLDIKAQFYVFK